MIEICRVERKPTGKLKTPKVKIEKDGMVFVDDKGEMISYAIYFPHMAKLQKKIRFQ